MATSVSSSIGELGKFEIYFQRVYEDDQFFMCSTVVVTSQSAMNDDRVKESLQILAKRHPFLQSVIREVDCSDGKYYYFIKMPSFKIEYQQCEKLATDPTHWEDVMSKNLLVSFDDQDGPLWRCCRLKECSDSQTGQITNCFVFSFNHAIIDGISMTMLYKEFLSILDKLHKNEVVESICYDVRPSLETLLGDKGRPEWWRRLGLKLAVPLNKIGLHSLKSKKIDVYFNKYPIGSNSDTNVTKESKVICTFFTKAETDKLIRACKEHGCTVNGAITAAASMAMADILQDGQVLKGQSIPSTYAVNCRKEMTLQEHFNIDYLGMDAVISEVECYVPAYNSKSFFSTFWKVSNNATCRIHREIESRKHLKSLREVQCVSLQVYETALQSRVWEHHGGRFGDALFFISNVGRCDEDA